MAFGLDQGAYAQNVGEQLASPALPLGTLRYWGGALWKYSRNTADVALRRGELLIVDPCDADVKYSFDAVSTNTAKQGKYAIGQVITATNGAEAIVAGEFAGMQLIVNDGDGVSQVARVEGNQVAAASASFEIYLQSALATALTVAGASDITIIPEDIVTESAASTLYQRVVGICPMAVTASYYFWRQVSGVAAVIDGTATPASAGTMLNPGDGTAGQALEIVASETLDDAFVIGQVIIAAKADGSVAMVRLRNLL